MRTTKQRKLVLEIINNSHDHLNAEDIYYECRKKLPNISLGTVYRILNQLSERQMIKRLKFESYDCFDSMKRQHSHFYCVKCHHIYDIFDELINVDKIKVPGKINDYDVKFVGTCDVCLNKKED